MRIYNLVGHNLRWLRRSSFDRIHLLRSVTSNVLSSDCSAGFESLPSFCFADLRIIGDEAFYFLLLCLVHFYRWGSSVVPDLHKGRQLCRLLDPILLQWYLCMLLSCRILFRLCSSSFCIQRCSVRLIRTVSVRTSR